MRITRSVTVAKPLDQVFAYLSDFTTTTAWDPGTVKTVRISGDGGLGTRYANTSTFNGRETDLVYEVIDFKAGERLQLRGENKTLTAIDTLTFEHADGGTRVTYDANFTFKGIAKLVAPFLAGAFKKLGDEAEVGLREAFSA
jgi:carbon monoxide dehydrogenase subunit G